mmetsp:Transcript_71814/g.208041  ORF Transcript_71814/g.208041 Transcript_71814/m.208041 type:complete len:298 (+) Transcript_71814:433-1326(+)
MAARSAASSASGGHSTSRSAALARSSPMYCAGWRTFTGRAGCIATSRPRTSASAARPMVAAAAPGCWTSTPRWLCPEAAGSRSRSAPSRIWRRRCSQVVTTSWLIVGALVWSRSSCFSATDLSTTRALIRLRRWSGIGSATWWSLLELPTCRKTLSKACWWGSRRACRAAKPRHTRGSGEDILASAAAALLSLGRRGSAGARASGCSPVPPRRCLEGRRWRSRRPRPPECLHTPDLRPCRRPLAIQDCLFGITMKWTASRDCEGPCRIGTPSTEEVLRRCLPRGHCRSPSRGQAAIP